MTTQPDDTSLTAAMTMPADALVWLTVKEAAARARCSPKMIYAAANGRKLEHTKVGGRLLRFRPSWVDSWLQSNVVHVEVRR